MVLDGARWCSLVLDVSRARDVAVFFLLCLPSSRIFSLVCFVSEFSDGVGRVGDVLVELEVIVSGGVSNSVSMLARRGC
jgi:hypothetical protein